MGKISSVLKLKKHAMPQFDIVAVLCIVFGVILAWFSFYYLGSDKYQNIIAEVLKVRRLLSDYFLNISNKFVKLKNLSVISFKSIVEMIKRFISKF